MRILFVTGEYPPMQGGVGSYTQELARALRTLNVETCVLTCEQAAAPHATMQTDGVRVLPAIRTWDWFMVREVSRLASELQADWLHVQYQTAAFGMHPAINFAPRLWRWRKRRPGLQVAWTYHDLLVPYLFPKAGGRLRRWVTEQPAHGAELVIVTNEGDRAQLAAQGVRPACIPIGSNIQGRRLTPEEREARRALRGFGPDDLVLGYFGFLNRSKGGAVLVRALHRLTLTRPHTHLLMIGDKVGASDPTNYAYLQEVEALIRELSLPGRVQWTGRQDDFEVGADLNACDVLVLPFTDGASLRRGTLMAGLANGCAIVTTVPQSPVTELVDGRDLLYVPPDDAAALALAVAQVADRPELAASLREHARARSELFSWQGIAQAHLALYSARPTRSET